MADFRRWIDHLALWRGFHRLEEGGIVDVGHDGEATCTMARLRCTRSRRLLPEPAGMTGRPIVGGRFPRLPVDRGRAAAAAAGAVLRRAGDRVGIGTGARSTRCSVLEPPRGARQSPEVKFDWHFEAD